MSLRPEDANRPHWSSSDPWSAIPHTPGAFPPSPNLNLTLHDDPKTITEAVKGRKDEYIRKKSIRVKVGSWNVAALHNTHRDLGGWFVQGLGVKGLSQDLTGPRKSEDSTDSSAFDSEIESVDDQEKRRNKKFTTLPKKDSAAVPSGDEVDLYVLGLQEVIDVSSVTEAMKPYTDPNPARKWKRALRKHLPGYKKVVEQQLIGLLLLVFASPDLAPQISSVDSTSVGTGLMGYLGNKGAVSARVLIGESTRILFVNCHLAAGADNTALNRRIWDTQQVVSRTKFAPVGEEWVGGVGQPEVIGDEDLAFWFGDLNYRLDDIPGEDVRRLLLLHARNEYDTLNASKRKIDSELGFISTQAESEGHEQLSNSGEVERSAAGSTIEPELDPENDPASLHTTLKSLLAHDQLRAQQRSKKAFHEGWREGEINFLPTYKYDVGSVAMFDSGEKKRSPSWCDRILFRTRLDYQAYQHKVKQEAESKKKDEEMKKRGIDDAASQDDVLFDYDPDADGDDYDDDVEQHDNDDDVELVRTKSAVEDAITVEHYVSHQRVLSSDHKPLSAVFSLTYDSVDPVLKAQIHQQVTRAFDKAENEARPSVTLVLDHQTYSTAVTDKTSDAPELKLVDFGEVRYQVLYEHHLTIANTGQIEVNFAFVTRPMNSVDSSGAAPIPSWIKVEVHQDIDQTKPSPPDLGSASRYKLLPGETTNIDLFVEINDAMMVRELNLGELILDDILVLRISNGRDYFIPVRGNWLQTCFCRSIDELVRVPSGVRSLTLSKQNIEAQQRPTKSVVHSAPQELFALTDAIPKITERVVADWEMLHDEDEPPWRTAQGWPFMTGGHTTTDFGMRAERLAEIREALDTASPIDEHLSPNTAPIDRLSLLSETLTSFLHSLTDGIITSEVWQGIESKLQNYEKTKQILPPESIQEIVMETVSTTPIHSVSLTFITFMLNRLISEITADLLQEQSALPTGRSRSSTTASAMSDVSLSSIRSTGSSKTRSFLSSLGRRSTSASTTTTPLSPTTTTTQEDSSQVEKTQLAHNYAEIFAPLIIRSDDAKMKAKEKKLQHARKVKVLQAFLNQQL